MENTKGGDIVLSPQRQVICRYEPKALSESLRIPHEK